MDEMSLVTTKEAAQILGVTPVRVRQLMRDGRLVAEKRGRDHLLEDREVRRFMGNGANRSLVWSYHCFRGERWCTLRQERLKAKSKG